jgi:alkylation response protein AidB-like acyl-CoA dehydrogenase
MYRAWRFEQELRHLVTACRNEPTLARLLEDGHYRQRIAQVQVDVEVLKRMVEQVVDDLVGGQPIGGRGSLSKLHWSEAHQRFAALAHEMVEQAPYPPSPSPSPSPSPEVAAAQRRFRKLYLQARAETIYAGTTQIQLGIIADRILKLPRGA